MLNILAITVPVYVLIGVGFLAGRFGLFSGTEMRALGKWVVNFAVPALLFTALSQRPIREILVGDFLLVYAGGSLVALLIGNLVLRFVRKKEVPLAALGGLGMGFSNSALIGYPIAMQLLGPTAAIALAMCVVVENLLILPLGLSMAESGSNDDKAWHAVLVQSLRRLATNPIFIAILAGLAVALLKLDLSEPLRRTVSMLANASTALALFVIGGSLVGLRFQTMLGDVVLIAGGKLLLHPLAVFALASMATSLDPKLRTAAVIYASVPMLSIYAILAQKYHQEGMCAAALLLSTLMSFLTVSAILGMLSALPG
jgi:malonate transporter